MYYPYLQRGIDETRAVPYQAENPKDPSESFGVAKSQCESQVLKAFGARGIVVRPTYIVGPGDTTDRFPYWPVAIVEGRRNVAPGHADDPMQIIDVRDLAEFMIRLLESGRRGVYNVAGPREPLTARRFYDLAAQSVGANVRYTYVDDYDFLAAHGIEEAIPWRFCAATTTE